ncbi:hydrogenase expression/formation protein HypE [Calothrix sp. NIES-3974]|uniref:hydrogenase expression/formation protein HypE n=1 Tax=Calothrix sp. NIES-3974 TaxID=2005462 RepID=UPI000B5DEEB5|nr:hydrogenase expression/formation protein HypE [Calothrix sp. NIES-3974]BAZ07265.1 hydrogenase expression/formation protein HypE [Calothrix sp. NIES-3974]
MQIPTNNSSSDSRLIKKAKVRDTHITLAHGSGGKAMRDLIDDIFVSNFDNPILSLLEDQASLNLASLMEYGNRLAFTTDSYVVDPLFFPGGDIGKLAVNGTINDLAVSGAKPLYLSCSVILEEGLAVDTLRRVAESMQVAANQAGVIIVTGDTKVVHRGAADQLFINTTGIGVIPGGINCAAQNIQLGDVVIINGELGNHGTAILIARGELALETNIESDCQPLHSLVETILDICPEIHAMRDVTRGGLATVLNEFAVSANVGIRLDEQYIPIREEVKGVCEILGLDPLYLANEGKLVLFVGQEYGEEILTAMKSHPAGKDACIIGEVVANPRGVVFLKSIFGAERIVDMLVGEQLPRIC